MSDIHIFHELNLFPSGSADNMRLLLIVKVEKRREISAIEVQQEEQGTGGAHLGQRQGWSY